MVGSANLSKKGSFFERIKFFKNQNLERDTTDIKSVISACSNMSASKTGALIVIERSNNLTFLGDSGDEMNITVTQPILESIFFKNSPLHDGAIIISNNIIRATRVVLPINNETKIAGKYGLRHRAAVSITEKTDAVAIVVSEESGKISYIKNGEFISFNSDDELLKLVEKDAADVKVIVSGAGAAGIAITKLFFDLYDDKWCSSFCLIPSPSVGSIPAAFSITTSEYIVINLLYAS